MKYQIGYNISNWVFKISDWWYIIQLGIGYFFWICFTGLRNPNLRLGILSLTGDLISPIGDIMSNCRYFLLVVYFSLYCLFYRPCSYALLFSPFTVNNILSRKLAGFHHSVDNLGSNNWRHRIYKRGSNDSRVDYWKYVNWIGPLGNVCSFLETLFPCGLEISGQRVYCKYWHTSG